MEIGLVERFNRSLKDTIQRAVVEQKPWKINVQSFQAVYRSTPHSVTGETPSFLLHSREMTTGLVISGFMSKSSSMVDNNALQNRVTLKQQKCKVYTDCKRSAKIPDLSVGDKVKIRKPTRSLKGHCTFSEPFIITKRVGPATFVTNDGRKWNAKRLSKYLSNDVRDKPNSFGSGELPPEMMNANNNVKPPVATNVPVRENRQLPTRQARRPTWTNDYVM